MVGSTQITLEIKLSIVYTHTGNWNAQKNNQKTEKRRRNAK